MRTALRLATLLLLLALVSPACQQSDPQSTTEFQPASDPRSSATATAETPEPPPIDVVLRGVTSDWARRSTWSDVTVESARKGDDGTLDFVWSSTAGDWPAPEVCDLMLSLRRGYDWSSLGAVSVTRSWNGEQQRISIPETLAKKYLSGALNDQAFFSAIGVDYP